MSVGATWGKLELARCGVATGGTRRRGGVECGDPREDGNENEDER